MAYAVESTRERVEKLVTQLKGERTSYEPHWREIADFIVPHRLDLNRSNQAKGSRVNQNIIDSTATQAAQILESGMMAGITSPARPWKRLTTPDPALAEHGAVKVWLHDVNRLMDAVFAGSTLYDALPTVYSGAGNFATGCLFVDEDDEDVIRCYAYDVGTYWLGLDGKQRVRTFAREYQLTVRQIVEQFAPGSRMDRDWTKVSPAVREAWERGETERPRDVGHVVCPNDQWDPGRFAARYKPYASYYYEVGYRGPAGDTFLQRGGYDEFPVMAPRWRAKFGRAYGDECPGMTALGDVKALQKMKKLGLLAVEKKVKPPMVGSPAMKTAKLSMLPGDISYVAGDPDGKQLRMMHAVDIDLGDLREEVGESRGQIRDAYFTNLFLMLALAEPREYTATEIMERKEEKLIALGPTLERMNKDLLAPLIDRTFAVMLRRGMVPDPPEQLYETPLKVEYVSIMAQAQKAIGIGALERFAGFVRGMLEATPNDLSLLDKIDRDQLVDEYAEMAGIPSRIVVPDEQVAEVRAQRAQAAQAEREAEMLAQAAPAAKQLSETRMGQDSALDALVGGGSPVAGLLTAGAGV